MAQPFAGPFLIVDASGVPVNGALVYTYEAGTFTPKAVFTTPDLTVAHPNPLPCPAGKATFFLGAGSYRIRVTTSLEDGGVELPQYALDEVTQSSGSGSGGTPTSFYSETQTATSGQTLFNIVGGSYVPGSDSLVVEIDGFDLERGADYSETSATSVTLSRGATAGQRVKFRIGRFTGTGLALSSVGVGRAEDISGGPADEASFLFRRRANYSGGTPGLVNSAVRADTFVESSPGLPSTASSFEWAGCFVVHNRSPFGENVGAYRQGIKYPGAGPTWGGTDEIIDWQTNPTSGAVGCELSFTANGTDTNRTRVGYDMALRKRDAAAASPVLTWGFRIQTEAGSTVQRAYGFAPGATIGIGFDTTESTITQAALAIAQGQPIAFNAALTRKMFHDGNSFLFTNAANTPFWSFNDNGSVLNGSTQVLGTRRTGWGAPTGTATRTTFATGSVTLPQLAERVKALVDDLTLHGLIGA